MKMKLYHNPRSRSTIARWMLEEVGAPYEIVPVDFEAGDTRKPDFLALNPMGKIPTLVLPQGEVVTEAPAIVAYLADAFPQAGLAPAPGSPERGPYYRWLFFGGSVFEPALTETMMRKGAAPLPRQTVGWGSYDEAVATLEAALAGRDHLIADRFTAADLYVGAQLAFARMFGAPRLAESPVLGAYIDRVTAREAYRRANA
ncbi:glutathione S-transferase [Aurantimonas sp. Leaf443]|nr:glutathione S-transferase [Aurantimonas sp. Leaf443]